MCNSYLIIIHSIIKALLRVFAGTQQLWYLGMWVVEGSPQM